MIAQSVADRSASTTTSREALLQLLECLENLGYDFLAPTPATQARVMARPGRRTGKTVVDLLGWGVPCPREVIEQKVLAALASSGMLAEHDGGLVAARLRVSRVLGSLFVHSAYPTTDYDSVFLGPDSFRFGHLIRLHLDGLPQDARVLDYAAGAGVGGITAATALRDAVVTFADINPKALAFASVNAEHAGVEHDCREARDPSEIEGPFDLIVTHPPFMMDDAGRAYRDGGDLFGADLSLKWVLAALRALAPGGRLVMHTGVSIVGGRDVLLDELRARMPSTGYRYDYEVLDPDIFGEELDQPAYAEVDRIAATGLCVERSI